jgi:hypothetical protein
VAVDEIQADGILLLDTGSPEDASATTDRVATGRPRPATVAVVIAAVVGVAWLVLGGEPAEAPPEPPPVPAPTSVVPAPPPTLGELAERSAALAVAVTSPQGDPGRVLWWRQDDAEPVVDETIDLRQVRFDATGRWVAGLGLAPRTGGGSVLWAGPVGGTLEPVEVGVRGYAWHDTRPGHLAWTSPAPGGTSALVTVNLASNGPHRRARGVDSDYRLRHWGDWGFALTSPNRAFRTTVLDAAGRVQAAQEIGLAVGWVPGGGVALSSREPDRAVQLLGADGRWWPAPWAHRGEQITHVAVAPDGRWAAAHLVSTDQRDPAVGGGRILLLRDGEPVDEIADVGGSAVPAWSPDGTFLVFARQDRDGSAATVVLWERATGEAVTLTVPGLRPSRDRIEALALQPVDDRR